MKVNVYEKMWRDLREFLIACVSLEDENLVLFAAVVGLMARYERQYGVYDEGDGNGNEC